MTKTLIVLAHPNPASFNRAWAEATEKASRGLDHQVAWSDLNAMGFDPVFDPEDNSPLPDDVQSEIAKVQQADRIIFHFPLWWFAPPAILKGWFDRVLAHGPLHSSTRRFDTGMCRGKTALFCVTTGSTASESAPDGKEGDVFMHLWPAAYTLRYCGFTVLCPITVHGVHDFLEGSAAQHLRIRLTTVLQNQKTVIEGFDTQPRIPFNLDTDFDAEGRLKAGRPSYSQFIRHQK